MTNQGRHARLTNLDVPWADAAEPILRPLDALPDAEFVVHSRKIQQAGAGSAHMAHREAAAIRRCFN